MYFCSLLFLWLKNRTYPTRPFKKKQTTVRAKDYKALPNLEDCYCDGAGIEQNYDATVDFYKHAADQHGIFAPLSNWRLLLGAVGITRDCKMAHGCNDTANKSGEHQVFNTHIIRYACAFDVIRNELLSL